MRSIRNALRLGAAVLAFSLAGAASAHAQATGTYRVPPARTPSQPAIDRALREFGFNPGALRADQQRALASTWPLLFPEVNRFRHSLNSSQATALVYVALVHGRERRGGWGQGDRDRWDGRDTDRYNDRGRDDERDRDWNDGRGSRGGQRSQCVDVNRRVYDAENALNAGNNNMVFVDEEQKRAIREAARDVQRQAIDRGWRRVADSASAVIASVAEHLPDREVVEERVEALKRAVDESCGTRDRGYDRQ
ncbi:MAG TPA: hypothetical protein VGB15_02370 [Longimicrobium sp.]|jgi:hypothetical protein